MPPASELAALEQISQGITERIEKQVDQALAHQRRMDVLGLVCAFIIALVGMGVALTTILASISAHQPVGALAGGAVGVGDLAALVAVFYKAR